jgi:hypothetical protein
MPSSHQYSQFGKGIFKGTMPINFFYKEIGLWCRWQKFLQPDTQVAKTEQCF